MIWNESPWAPWGLMLSTRDGFPTLAESMLWELEGRHPQAVEHRGEETFLHLDKIYRVEVHPHRAYLLLIEVPGAPRRPAPDAKGRAQV